MSRPPEWVDHFVYRVWDAKGALLYIGCSKNVENRIRQHRYDSPEWYFDRALVTVDGPYSYSTARSVEREAIRTENPWANMQTAANMRARRESSRLWAELQRTRPAAEGGAA